MSSTLRRRVGAPAAAVGALSLVLAGCAAAGAEELDAGGGTECSAYEQYGTHDGQSVEIYATIVELEADNLVSSWSEFEGCTGITIDYAGTTEGETQITVRAVAGDAPDLMIIPQPGLLRRLVEDGFVRPAASGVEVNVDAFWSDSWKEHGTVDGTFYAAPLTVSVKGYVWYSPADFEENGYEIPATWDEMMALTDEMTERNAGSYRPWCVGPGSGDDAVWPGIEWIEDAVVRSAGSEVYNEWIAGELEFSSPKITEAFDMVGDILLNPDYVSGGVGGGASVVSTTAQQDGLPIIDGTCSMQHQSFFSEAQWGDSVTVAPDGDIWAFITPPMSADDVTAITGRGEFVAAFNDRAATQAVQTYLASDTWVNNRVALGGVISANQGLDATLASSELGVESIRILQGAETVFCFDGSDFMTATVGTRSFWAGMEEWGSGALTTDELTAFVDSTFP